jgi:hypothetical protein
LTLRNYGLFDHFSDRSRRHSPCSVSCLPLFKKPVPFHFRTILWFISAPIECSFLSIGHADLSLLLSWLIVIIYHIYQLFEHLGVLLHVVDNLSPFCTCAFVLSSETTIGRKNRFQGLGRWIMRRCLSVELLDKLECLIHIDHRLLLNLVISSKVWSRLVAWDLRERRD